VPSVKLTTRVARIDWVTGLPGYRRTRCIAVFAARLAVVRHTPAVFITVDRIAFNVP